MLHTSEVMAIFVILWPILAKIWFPWQHPLDPCNQKSLLWIGQPRKIPVISNRVLVISHEMHLCAFIAIFVPKLVAMVTPLCPFCTGVSQVNSRWQKLYLKTELCIGVSLTTEVLAIFVVFLPILAKIWLLWQHPLDPCNQKCLIWIGRPPKPYPRTKNFIDSCYTSEVMSIQRFATSLALRE